VKILIIVAHGSRREQSNQEVKSFVDKLGKNLKGTFNKVSYAFLEFSPITIESVIKDSFKSGAQEITVFPLFVSAGKHVSKDIPLAIGRALEEYPEGKVFLKDHLGAHSGLLNLVSSACV
jgi:sirohydrochlorin ferrochelatase